MKKRNFLQVFILFLMCFYSFNACARVVLFINSKNSCQDVKGVWEGKGKLGSIFTDCVYQGFAKISGDKKVTLETVFQKVTGPDWCKPRFQLKLNGVCENNIVDLDHKTVHISGTTAGKTVQLEGTLDLALNTYLEIDLHKKPQFQELDAALASSPDEET